MLLNYLKPVLYFIPLAVIQLVIVPLISIADIAPNVILIMIVFYTLKYGQIYGMITGFVLGFVLDLISGGLAGAFMFSFTVSVFIAGYFYNENKIEINTASPFYLVILFIAAAVNAFLYSAVANANSDVGILYLAVEDGILPGLYTTALGLSVVIFNTKKGIE